MLPSVCSVPPSFGGGTLNLPRAGEVTALFPHSHSIVEGILFGVREPVDEPGIFDSCRSSLLERCSRHGLASEISCEPGELLVLLLRHLLSGTVTCLWVSMPSVGTLQLDSRQLST